MVTETERYFERGYSGNRKLIVNYFVWEWGLGLLNANIRTARESGAQTNKKLAGACKVGEEVYINNCDRAGCLVLCSTENFSRARPLSAKH
jgi:hypothetical protein